MIAAPPERPRTRSSSTRRSTACSDARAEDRCGGARCRPRRMPPATGQPHVAAQRFPSLLEERYAAQCVVEPRSDEHRTTAPQCLGAAIVLAIAVLALACSSTNESPSKPNATEQSVDSGTWWCPDAQCCAVFEETQAFVARHDSCSRDSDCAVVGGPCFGSTGIAVRKEYLVAAERIWNHEEPPDTFNTCLDYPDPDFVIAVCQHGRCKTTDCGIGTCMLRCGFSDDCQPIACDAGLEI